MRRCAVIDMGSNSFRLVVYGYERGSHWQHLDEIREPVRVSAGMGDDGRLGDEQIDRAVRTASLFSSFCETAGIDEVTAVATSAIRRARNRRRLLDRVRRSSGLAVRVISEREEARYGYLAIANSTTLVDGFGIDLGGGSVQAMQIADRRLERSESWPLGTVRVSEAFLEGDRASAKRLRALRRHVRRTVAGVEWLAPAGGGVGAVGIGGTIRNLAAAAEKRAGLPYTDAQGFRLTRAALGELIDELARLPPSKRGRVPGIKPDRGDVILGGAVVLDELMEQGGLEAVEATDAGLREGIFFERFLADCDPSLFDDVRRASVMNLARRYQSGLAHARHVAQLSLELHDGLVAAGLADAGTADRELLWAACMLHDIGTVVDYDDHHKHSRYLILNAGLPGFSPREIELVALVARYHRKGDPDVSELGPLARKGDGRRLSLLSAVIRLAEQLERSRDGAVRSLDVTAVDGRLEITARTRADATVALWSARRNADLLERVIGREVAIVAQER